MGAMPSMLGGAGGAGGAGAAAGAGAGKSGLGSMLPGGSSGMMAKSISSLANGQLNNTSGGGGGSGIPATQPAQDYFSEWMDYLMRESVRRNEREGLY